MTDESAMGKFLQIYYVWALYKIFWIFINAGWVNFHMHLVKINIENGSMIYSGLLM